MIASFESNMMRGQNGCRGSMVHRPEHIRP
jgi:hypothetical protein